MRRRLYWLLPVATVLAACGQRGDLYFPSEQREAVLTVPAQVPAQPAAPDDDADENTTQQDAAGTPNADNTGR